MSKQEQEEVQKTLPTTELEAFNIFVQVCNAFKGDRADFQKIEESIKIFKKMPKIKKQMAAIEQEKTDG